MCVELGAGTTHEGATPHLDCMQQLQQCGCLRVLGAQVQVDQRRVEEPRFLVQQSWASLHAKRPLGLVRERLPSTCRSVVVLGALHADVHGASRSRMVATTGRKAPSIASRIFLGRSRGPTFERAAGLVAAIGRPFGCSGGTAWREDVFVCVCVVASGEWRGAGWRKTMLGMLQGPSEPDRGRLDRHVGATLEARRANVDMDM